MLIAQPTHTTVPSYFPNLQDPEKFPTKFYKKFEQILFYNPQDLLAVNLSFL